MSFLCLQQIGPSGISDLSIEFWNLTYNSSDTCCCLDNRSSSRSNCCIGGSSTGLLSW